MKRKREQMKYILALPLQNCLLECVTCECPNHTARMLTLTTQSFNAIEYNYKIDLPE